MHFDYESVTGEVFSFDVDVSSEISEAFVGREVDEDHEKAKGLEKAQSDKNRAETRRHYSLDDEKHKNKFKYISSPDNTEEEALRNIDEESPFQNMDDPRVRAMVEALTPDERYIIKRRFLDPIPATYQEIAEEMGLTASVIQKRFDRVKKKANR